MTERHTGAQLVFEGGNLSLDLKDGNFAFTEVEPVQCDEGWRFLVHLPNSELEAIRDFLNKWLEFPSMKSEPESLNLSEKCSMCGLPIHPSESGVRHFGTGVAHPEYRCRELLRTRIEEGERARTEAESHRALYAKALIRLKETAINALDRVEHEGDRAYFGSTNDFDALNDATQHADAIHWEELLAHTQPKVNLYEAIENRIAERDAAESRAHALQARVEALEGALQYDAQVLNMLVLNSERGPGGHGMLTILSTDEWRCIERAREKIAALLTEAEKAK